MNREERRPVFLVFEGLDGSGKTTCAKRTAELLGAHFMTTPSEALRGYRDPILASFKTSQEAAQLFYLATVVAASREIDAHLASGVSVVLDRYLLSTQVYAEFRGSKLNIDEEIERLLRPADLTVFLDVPLEVRQARIAKRAESSVADQETFSVAADRTLRAGYNRWFENRIVGDLLRLDASRNSADELTAEIVKIVGSCRDSSGLDHRHLEFPRRFA
jgi:dTMP kinase